MTTEVEAAEPDGMGWFPRFVLTYVDNTLLWPVLFAVLVHVALVIAALLVFAVRDLNAGAMALLVPPALATVSLVRMEIRWRERPGGLAVWMALTWLGSAGLAWACAVYGVV